MDISREVYALELRQRGHRQHLLSKYTVPPDEIVHNTLESNFEDDIGDNHDKRPREQDSMINQNISQQEEEGEVQPNNTIHGTKKDNIGHQNQSTSVAQRDRIGQGPRTRITK